MKTVILVPPVTHRNSKGELFELTVSKAILSEQHDYWLYTVQTKHEEWGTRGFSGLLTKRAYPNKAAADELARTLMLDEVKARLELATPEGLPLFDPSFNEGWCLI